MASASPRWGDAPLQEAASPLDNTWSDPLRDTSSPAPEVAAPVEDTEEDEEEFVYPSEGASAFASNILVGYSNTVITGAEQQEDTTGSLSLTDSLSYPGVSASPSVVSPLETSPSTSRPGPLTPALAPPPVTEPSVPLPSPAQLEAIYAAASSGDLTQLRRLFRTTEEEHHVGAFSLANDATSRTGLTPLHAASSRGHLDIAQWRMLPSPSFSPFYA